ncbi:hypothetical protein LBMAG49_27500 [Planctomycetota bacterium]|nr:hypothetical protein LBMAG49_27500 [Planctomycetota bacterium]
MGASVGCCEDAKAAAHWDEAALGGALWLAPGGFLFALRCSAMSRGFVSRCRLRGGIFFAKSEAAFMT